MSQDKLSLSAINKLENTIRECEKILFLKHDQHEKVLSALRKISVRSGMAIYSWQAQKGLVNVKSNEAPLPRTKTIFDALKYANNNHYFSVYVFPVKEKAEELELKASISSWSNLLEVNEKARYLFLLPSHGINEYLQRNGQELDLKNKNTHLYKLRNSIWILADE